MGGGGRDWGGPLKGFGFAARERKGKKKISKLVPKRDVFTAEFEGLSKGRYELKPLPATPAVKAAYGKKLYGAGMPFMRFGPSDVPKSRKSKGKEWRIRI